MGRLRITFNEGESIYIGEDIEIVYLGKASVRAIKVMVIAPNELRVGRSDYGKKATGDSIQREGSQDTKAYTKPVVHQGPAGSDNRNPRSNDLLSRRFRCVGIKDR